MARRTFRRKKIGIGERMAEPDAKQIKASRPKRNSRSSHTNTNKKRVNLPAFSQRCLRLWLRSSRAGKRPHPPIGTYIVDITQLHQ